MPTLKTDEAISNVSPPASVGAAAVPLVVVDAFTTRVFHGNPAAVVLLTMAQAAAAPDAMLLGCAAEMNLSETVFLSPIECGDDGIWRGAYGQVPLPPGCASKIDLGVAPAENGLNAHASPDASGNAHRSRRACFVIRWFTPTREVGLCGHATVAAAHALFTSTATPHPAASSMGEGGCSSQRGGGNPFALSPSIEGMDLYNPASGWLGVASRSRIDDAPGADAAPSYVLDFPMRTPTVALWAIDQAREGMQCQLEAAPEASHAFQLVRRVAAALQIDVAAVEELQLHQGSAKYLLVVSREEVVRSAALDVDALRNAFAPVLPPDDSSSSGGGSGKTRIARWHLPVAPLSLTITSRSAAETAAHGADVVSRHFAPWVGIDEDPVTGAAHVVLVPYWLRRMDQERQVNISCGSNASLALTGQEVPLHQSLRCYQASARGGYLTCTSMPDGRLALQGSAVTFLSGTAFLPLAAR